MSCGATDLRTFYRVASIPVHSCLLMERQDQALAFPLGDVELAFCEQCGFIQNNLFDPLAQDYADLHEDTQAFSPRFRRFIDELCDGQIRKYALTGKKVLEIGCGQGEFLTALCERGECTGIGIDPAYRAERNGSASVQRTKFIADYYGERYGHLEADYICCRHTLEHIQNVGDFIRVLRRNIDGRQLVTVMFELPDMTRVLAERAFWDIYYEHCSYFTLGSLARLFRRSAFEVTGLWRAYDDQYLVIEARPAAGPTEASEREGDDLELTRQQVAQFERGVATQLASLRADVDGWHRAAKKVVVWGSGSKAISYLNTLGLGQEIAFAVDINPHKHGRFMAGTGHQIVSPDELIEIKPDVVVAMNAIYVEEIRSDLHRRGLTPEITALG